MSKTPEEYFQEQPFSPERAEEEGEFTPAEKAFLEKYVGPEEEDILEKLGIDAPAETKSVPLIEYEKAADHAKPAATPQEAQPAQETPETKTTPPAAETEQTPVETAEEAPRPEAVSEEEQELSLEDRLKQEPLLQMVGFHVGKQEYTIPIEAVQEVVKYVPPTKLYMAPDYLAGIVNLRGRVTPLVKLNTLLGMEEDEDRDGFIIVCKHRGLQVGLLIRDVASMHRVEQEKVDWNIDAKMGGDIELVSALTKFEDKLIGMISIDRIIEKVMKK